MRCCNYCNKNLPESHFQKTPEGYFRRRCKPCDWKAIKERANRDECYAAKLKLKCKKSNKQKNEKSKIERAAGLKTEKYILEDSRKSDRRKGFKNDLDNEFIKETISCGCSYCGTTELRMTLDRIDNDKGHLKSNVVPSCIRCNYIRRNMPYQAWMWIVPSIRSAVLHGLLDGWTNYGCGNRNGVPEGTRTLTA